MRRDRDLERELEDLGSRIEYPPTPDLAGAVLRRLEEGDRTPRRRGFGLPDLSARWAAAAALLLFLAVPLLSPATRETFSGWFVAAEPPAADGGKPQDAAVEPGDAAPRPSSSERAEPIGANRGLGERITLREARARAGDAAPVLLPRAMKLGEPDEVYALGPSREDGVALVYRSRPGLSSLGGTGIGLVLTEVPGDLESAYLETRSATGFEEVNVDGGRGFWYPEGHHPAPPVVGRSWHPRADVLLWEREGRALRMEANLPKAEAVRIAGSTR
jgi:hypothetical protein